MSNSDFEKNVQHELDDLSIEPSDALWDRVEAQLPEKKRRRWVLLFLPLLIAGAIFFIADYDNDNTPQDSTPGKGNNFASKQKENKSAIQQKENKSALSQQENLSGIQQQKNPEKETVSVTNTVTSSSTKSETPQDIDGYAGKKKVDQEQNHSAFVKSKTNFSKSKPGVSRKADAVLTDAARLAANIRNAQPEDESQSNVSPTQKPSLNNLDPIPGSLINGDTSSKTLNSARKDKVSVTAKDSDTTSTHLDTEPKTNAVVSAKESDTIPKKVAIEKIKKAGKEWVLGITAGVGIANVKSGLFNNNQVYADVLSSGSTSGTPTSPAFAPVKPRDPEDGFAFVAGVVLEKNLNSKLTFQSGLHYTYLSSRLETGVRVDSSGNFITNSGTAFVDSYYRNGALNNYVNRFHFISLPLLLQFQPVTRTPLFAEAGFTTSLLIGSNALQYSSTRNAYYHNQESYNKLTFGLQAGIGAQLKSLKLGYRFNYTLNSILKDASPQHPVSSIIYLQLTLKKF